MHQPVCNQCVGCGAESVIAWIGRLVRCFSMLTNGEAICSFNTLSAVLEGGEQNLYTAKSWVVGT